MKPETETKMDIVSESGQTVVFLRRTEKGWPVDFVSENIAEFGYNPEDFFSKNLLYDEIIYSEDLEKVHSEFFTHYEKKDRDFTLVYRILTKSGQIRWVVERILLLPDQNNSFTRFSGTVLDITDKAILKESISRKLEIEKVLVEISNMFTNPASLERDINLTLERIGILCGAGRSYIFQIHEDGNYIDNTHEWCAEGVEPQKENLQNTPSSRCPWWAEKLHKDGIIHITDVSVLPPEAAAEKDLLEKQGIKSLIVLPLYAGGKLAGFMGMDNVVNTGSWKEDDISILRITANLVGMGIERRKSEKAIHAGEEIYRSMFQNAANLIILVDSKGVIIDCNSRTKAILGYTQEELRGRPIKSIIFSGCMKKHNRSLKEIEERGFSFNKEYRMIKKNGRYVDINVNSSGLKDENGKHIQTIYILEDITERKTAEKLLRESENRYRSLFQNNSAVIMLIDPDTGNVYDANQAACSYYGYTREQMLSLNISNINILPREKILEELEQAKSRDLNHFFFTHRLSSGELRDIEKYSYPIPINEKIFLYTIISDITDNKKMQSELVRAKMEAEIANKAKSEFLANMSHELRTPLNSIIGFSDMLLTQNFGPLNEKQLRYVNNITVSGSHLLKLINDVLDISKVEAGKMELQVEKFSISGSVSEVKSLLVPLASKKNIEILNRVDDKLESISADRTKFKQILYNLMDNAIKFTPEGGHVTVDAKIAGAGAEITVMDTGIGISEEESQKIFKPFVQLENPEFKKQKGTGLGLSLVKKFVEMHSGKIWVESKSGEGSKFVFTIPLNLYSRSYAVELKDNGVKPSTA
ncbi:PAS domain S-box protein [Methanosarcina hadiensis]|uniref:sensor histidine kinase n=1 Tax=Methanosarcina hadiensis TaxID=3078083 RepID=UPI003977798A